MSDQKESRVITTRDFDRLSKSQQDTLNLIAIGQDGGHARSTLRSLVGRGLIEEFEQDMGGGLTVKRYEMPIPVHIMWCEWAAAQMDELGEDEDA